MRIAIFQYAPEWEDKDSNKSRLGELAGNLDSTVDLMIFPELTLTGFTMRSRSFAEEIGGESAEFFRQLARKYRCHIFFGMIEKQEQRYYNALLHVEAAGGVAAVYRKIHPFSFSGENRFYQGGREPKVTRIGGVNIGLTICYDLRFPELYRIYGKAQTELIVNIANWPETRIAHWQTLLRARAIENQCYVIGVNRVGKDKKNQYTGCSAVFHPYGDEILMVQNREEVSMVDLDFNEVERVRRTYPFLADMVLI